MKKTRIRRIVNFILCVALFANILAGQAMAMNSGNQVRGDPQEVLESMNEVDESEEDTGEPESVEEQKECTKALEASLEQQEGSTEEPEESSEQQEEDSKEPEDDTEQQEESTEEPEESEALAEDTESGDAIALFNASGNINLGQFNNGGEIVLDGDATANGMCQLSSGTLTIDLNGHQLTMGNGAYFMLNSEKAVLNIKDSTGGGIIYASCQLIWGYNGGTVNLYGGTLDGSKVKNAGQMGGCINLGRSNMGNHTFNMYGGIIRNFKATQYGGAVYVAGMFSGRKNTFNMYGGTIEDCYAPAGSAVYVDDSGDGPGYFYIKGGTRQEEGGETKAVIRCTDGPNAIYNYGYLGMEGVVEIEGIVYLNQNNWASTTTHFIKITGRLVVTGTGYIDIDSAYPNSQAVCPGHTVVENVTQTEKTGSVTISQEEFYTYSSYFRNTTKGLMVSAGFDPSQNELDGNGAPANWPTYQADKYDKEYTYVDVMGQELLIQASDSPGPKRQMQNYNYLIYTDRADPSIPYKEYYSVKILKKDMDSGAALNKAEFQLVRTHDADGTELEIPQAIGVSAPTGDTSKGLEDGMTYLYLPGFDGKLMIEDGIYELREITPPDGYICRDNVITLHIYHKINEESGQKVSVVEVRVNGIILSAQEQEINSTYHDSGWMVEREIVLKINNTTSKIDEDEKTPTWNLQAVKYGTKAEDALRLAGAEFTLFQLVEEEGTVSEKEIVSVTSSDGTDGHSIGDLVFADENGKPLELSCNTTYLLRETSAPMGYTLTGDIRIEVNEDGSVLTVTKDGEPYSGASYDAENKVLTLSIVDETVYQLPETGRRGIYPLLVCSVILLYGSLMTGYFLFGKKYRNGK